MTTPTLVQHVETLWTLKRIGRGRRHSEMMYVLAPTLKQLWDTVQHADGASSENLRAAGWKPIKVTVMEVVDG